MIFWSLPSFSTNATKITNSRCCGWRVDITGMFKEASSVSIEKASSTRKHWDLSLNSHHDARSCREERQQKRIMVNTFINKRLYHIHTAKINSSFFFIDHIIKHSETSRRSIRPPSPWQDATYPRLYTISFCNMVSPQINMDRKAKKALPIAFRSHQNPEGEMKADSLLYFNLIFSFSTAHQSQRRERLLCDKREYIDCLSALNVLHFIRCSALDLIKYTLSFSFLDAAAAPPHTSMLLSPFKSWTLYNGWLAQRW